MEQRRFVERDAHGLISTVVDEDRRRLVHIKRDEAGRLLGLDEYYRPGPPTAPEVLERVDRVEEKLDDTRREVGEVAQILDLRQERLRRRVDAATTPPEPATWTEFHDRMARMTTRLGGRRDGSGLHLSVAGAAVAASTGDVVRAVELLRGAEDQP